MKLGRIQRGTLEGSVPRLVVAQPDQERVIDLATAEYHRLLATGATTDAARRLATALYPSSMRDALAAGPTFLAAAQRTVASLTDHEQGVLPIQSVSWLAPLDPPLMRDCLAFEQHLRNSFLKILPEIPRQYYEMPLYYKGNPLTLVGHNETIPWPSYTRLMDYELELGFVIGRTGKDLKPEQVSSYLLGVTILNDFSARDIQMEEMQGLLGPAKGKDFATALGPWITTVDEVDVHNLTMVARVNGEEWSRGSSSTIMWQVDEIIAYISKDEGVQVGELIGSGTVGFGCGLEHGKLLKPGDVVELEIEGIGVLRNKVGTPAPAGWTPQPRTPTTA
jgi:2-keto-4-pentenoate hydratase/2-oxohepta-3-ene-1,7-dioic acid hydratase in catechol pathway